MEAYFDREIAMRYCGNSEDIYYDVMKSYASQGKKYIGVLNDLLAQSDWGDYAIIVHAIKNTSSTVGAKGLSSIAFQLERVARKHQVNEVKELHNGFIKELARAVDEAEKIVFLHDSKLAMDKQVEKGYNHDAGMLQGTILMIDDDSTNLTLGQSFLSDEYRVIGVKSGEMAFRYLRKNIPDIILLDITMPGMDGFQIMDRLKSEFSYADIPVVFLTSDRSVATEEKCFEAGGIDFIGKPFVPEVMKQRVRRILELESYKHNLEHMVAEQLQKITQLQTDIIVSMGNLVESRDGTTGEHIKRTAVYTEYLARKTRMSGLYKDVLNGDYISYLCKAAPLHDIGKIAVSDTILQKPGKLEVYEYAQMQLHTVEGDRIIRRNMSGIADRKFVDMAATVARYHHEKWNGNGYPDGLAGEKIPLSARILAIADVFDALIARRQYKEGIPFPKAVAIMMEERGKSFEPALLDVFLKNKEELRTLVNKLN